MKVVININLIISSNDIRNLIRKIYDISEIIDCKFIRRSFNDHYLIETKDNKYILRVYLNNKYYINDIDDFKFELDLLSFLNLKKLPVSYPIKNIKDEVLSKIIYKNEVRFITMFSFAPGTSIDTKLNKDIAIKFGQDIAKIHKESTEFRSIYKRYKIDADYLIKEPIEMLRKYSKKYNLNSINFLDLDIRYLYKKIEEIPLNDETYGIIHGDLNPSNIHLDNEKNITIFDFDHCAYGFRIHDLAVIKLCYENITYEHILKGYKSIRILLNNEEEMIDLYSNILLIRKYKDVLSMLKISDNEINKNFNEQEFITSGINELNCLIGKIN